MLKPSAESFARTLNLLNDEWLPRLGAPLALELRCPPGLFLTVLGLGLTAPPALEVAAGEVRLFLLLEPTVVHPSSLVPSLRGGLSCLFAAILHAQSRLWFSEIGFG